MTWAGATAEKNLKRKGRKNDLRLGENKGIARTLHMYVHMAVIHALICIFGGWAGEEGREEEPIPFMCSINIPFLFFLF